MTILVTGSSGHLGEAMVRTLRAAGRAARGLDVKPASETDIVGSIADGGVARAAMRGATAVVHAATLHKPHVATHSRQDFVDTNITGTLNLLEAAAAEGVGAFVFTSTTSVFGRAMRPPPGAPAAWIDESVRPVPKNIYGVTKTAAEDLCELAHLREGLACVVLRTSRFFPEVDDDPEARGGFDDLNLKVNELTYRRLDIEDVVGAHLAALKRAAAVGFGRYVVSATTPFAREDAAELGIDAPSALARRSPGYPEVFARLGWRMLPRLDRVYDNALARSELGWAPKLDFAEAVRRLSEGRAPFSDMARAVGVKGYHGQAFRDGRYPVEG